MNDLIRVENGEVKIDSRMISEHFGKQHKHVLSDIKDEISKLGELETTGEPIFRPSSYSSAQNKKMPCFEMSEEGAMQLAARYDAVSRRKLILKIKELKSSAQQIPKSPMEFIALMAQQNVETEKQVQRLSGEVQNITGEVQVLKDAFIPESDDWRESTNTKINRIVKQRGGVKNDHIAIRRESYEMLERMARADLDRRLQGLQDRLRRTGATASVIKAASKLDIIETDARLKAIYTGVVEKLVMKYC